MKISVNMEKRVFGEAQKITYKGRSKVEELQRLLQVGFRDVTDFQGQEAPRKWKNDFSEII